MAFIKQIGFKVAKHIEPSNLQNLQRTQS